MLIHCDNLECLGKMLEVQEMQERLLQVWASFRSRQEFPGRDNISGLVATGVPCVATWSSGCRQLLGCDIVFSCHDSALFLCCDDVVTEVSMS